MMTTLMVLLLLEANQTQGFAQDNPGSELLQSPDGQLVHASGFTADTGAQEPEDAARAFLTAYGDAFGITERQTLVVKGAPAAGEVGAVQFERNIDGLPVFGGDLVVGHRDLVALGWNGRNLPRCPRSKVACAG